MHTERPRIALTMIARDEERSLGRALASVQGLVDVTVVIDTGSTDATIDIARAHGAVVDHFTWIDDFAAARNHALRVADADVSLVLDADEWIEASDRSALHRWSVSAPLGTAGLVNVRNQTMSDGSVIVTEHESVRLLPRGSRYEGRVHEQVYGHSRVSHVPGVRIEHDGYLPEQLSRKRGRNEKLIRAALAEHPTDPYLLFQLGKELQIAGDHTAAIAAYEAVVPVLDHSMSWRDELRARLLYCVSRARGPQEAIRLADTLLRDADRSAEVVFAAGNVFLDAALAMPERHAPLVELARSAWRACMQLGEPRDGRDSTPGCGSYLAAENLAALSAAEGDDAGASEWRRLSARFKTVGT